VPRTPDPDIDTQLDAAIASHEARDLNRAEILYRGVLSAQPDNAEAMNLLGVVLQDRGQPEASIALISRALEIDPDFPDALANLARGRNFLGQSEAAATTARRATEVDPDLGEGWLQLGRAELDLMHFEEALDALREASSHFPDSTEIYAGMGYASLQLGKAQEASEAWRVVLEMQPGRLDAMVNLSAACLQLEEFDEALRLVREAVALAPDDIDVMCAHAVVLHKRNDAVELVAVCQEVLRRAPARADILTMLGAGQMWLGQFDDAIKNCHAALALDPDHIAARYNLGRMSPDTLADATLELFREVLSDPSRPLPDRGQAGFAIAAALDKSRDFDAAFEMYQTANGLYREHIRSVGKPYDRREFLTYIDWARAVFPSSRFAEMRDAGVASELPVFIVGLPRSGTTLVEQILASHPRVHGAGERKDVSDMLQRINRVGAYVPVQFWEVTRAHREAEQYVERLAALGAGADRVIDKMPDNIKVLGQIRLMFPNARIIICHRDPRDVCVSCFSTPFGEGLNWALDIEDCATQVLDTRVLTNFWKSVLPGPMIEVQYEALVENIEAESRRLVAYLGLEWDPACLEFHKTDRKVTTASSLQVRQPLYSSAVAKWRRYESHLEAMLRILKDYPVDAPTPQDEPLRCAAQARADGNLARAVEILGRASNELPTAHDIHAELARALADSGNIDGSISAWRRAVAEQPGNVHSWRAFAAALWKREDATGTRDAYKQALARAPDDPTTLRALAEFEMMFGHFDEAASYYRRILARNPDAMAARLGLLVAGKAEEAGNLDELQSALGDPSIPLKERLLAGWALAKALDANGDYDNAFLSYARVNALLREQSAPQCHEMKINRLTDRVIESFPPGAFRETVPRGNTSRLPVFVVGLPRSGSTLVEQILASHPKVFGAGERNDIFPIVDTIEQARRSAAAAEGDPIAREATTEVERLRELGGGAERVIDKLPGNIFWLGHIRLMLPRAPILICRRDPRDIGLSCFMTYFSDGQEWTTDLDDIAAHIRAVERMIAHWRTVLPGPFVEVQYEDLVQDPERQSRRMVEFIGLDWDPACLDFHRTERAVNTASVWQVRQPLYGSSIGRWRSYERHLRHFLDGIGDIAACYESSRVKRWSIMSKAD
jgi:tetratricopeptide (TPR) repeat protein